MKIGIIGIGFVGGAILDSFVIKNISVFGYDKYKKIGSINTILDTEIVFLCLPTLYNNEKKEYNKTAIYEVINILNKNNYKGLVVIKSTIEPETTQNLGNKYTNLNICHNPEFLTARTAFIDFHNQKHIVIGKNKNSNIDKLYNLYKNNYKGVDISICTSLESESMKIMCNSFYASKIMLFNEYYKVCETNGSNFNTVKNLMLKNNWINPMHTFVPGTDGKLGYGGACFPKDSCALNQYMINNNLKDNIIGKVIEKCKEYRI